MFLFVVVLCVGCCCLLDVGVGLSRGCVVVVCCCCLLVCVVVARC